MVASVIIGIIILAIIVFTVIKIIKNVLLGLILIGLILFASFLILGSIPGLESIPIIGPKLPRIPTSIGEFIAVIKKFFYSIKIAEVSRDSRNNLLITVENKGRIQVSNFTVYVDNKTVDIINEPKDPLKSGEITTIQTDWRKDFTGILVQTSEVNTTYSK